MFGLKKILLPVDFSPRSHAVVRYAEAFVQQCHSDLLILHVEDGPLYDGALGILAAQAGRVEHLQWVKTQVQPFLAKEVDGHVIKRELVEGDAATTIVDYAKNNQVDLIMMPTRGYGAYRRFLLGSVTAKVLHDSDIPIWTATHIEEIVRKEPVTYKKIACAIDLGPHTEQLLSAASGLTNALGAKLLVVHVTQAPMPFAADAFLVDLRVKLVENARDDITLLLEKLNVKAGVAVESGSVIEETYKRVAQFGADLLVVGRHVAKGIGGRLYSHTYAFIRESLCPVVSI